MRDKGVIMGAVVCALLGIVVLSITAQKMQPAHCEISSIVEPGAYVACQGIVYQCKYTDEHCFVKLFDGGAIDVPFFNYTGDISVGDFLYVEGTVSLYNEHLEIIPKKYEITKVSYKICFNSELSSEKTFYKNLDKMVAVVTFVDGDPLDIAKITDSFVSFHGRISSSKQGNVCTFQVFGSQYRFSSVAPVAIGEVSGFGVKIDDEVTVLYHEWDELPLDTIAEAKEKPEGYPVKVSGVIQSVHVSKGHIFLVIQDSTGCILVPIFKNRKDILGVDAEMVFKGQKITVTGIVKVYQGAPEILPEVVE